MKRADFDVKLFCHRCIGLLGQSQVREVGPLRSWLPYVFQRHGMQWKVCMPQVRHAQLGWATFQQRSCKTCSDMLRFCQRLTKSNATLCGSNLLFTICASLLVFISQYYSDWSKWYLLVLYCPCICVFKGLLPCVLLTKKMLPYRHILL